MGGGQDVAPPVGVLGLVRGCGGSGSWGWEEGEVIRGRTYGLAGQLTSTGLFWVMEDLIPHVSLLQSWLMTKRGAMWFQHQDPELLVFQLQ